MPQLILSIEGEFPSIHDLEKDEIKIGRDPGNEIHIPLNFISSFHAALKKESNGHYRLIDKGSHNGTSVNGNSLGSAVLEDGDRISLGPIKGVFRAGARSSVKPAAGSAKSSGGSREPAAKTSPPLAVLGEGESKALSEVDLQARLREKVQRDLATEFADEKARVDELKRAAEKLEEEHAAIRQRLATSRSDLESIKKEAADQRSEMAMSNHLIHDLEKAREAQQKNLDELRSIKDGLLEDHKSIQGEIEGAGKELDAVREEIAGEREAAAKKAAEHEAEAKRLDREIKAREKAEADLARAVAEKVERLAKIEKEFEGKGREMEKKSEAHLRELENEADSLDKKIAAKRAQVDSLIVEFEETDRKNKETAANLEEVKRELEDVKRGCEETKEKLGDAKRGLEDIASRREDARREVEEAQRQHDETKGELEEAKRQLEETKAERGEAKRRCEDAKRQCEDAKRECEDAKRECEDAKREREDTKGGLEEAKRQLEEAKREREEAKRELGDAIRELEDTKRQRGEAQKNSEETRKALESLRNELADLEKKQAEQQSKLDEKNAELSRLEEECRKRAGELDEIAATKKGQLKEHESATEQLAEARRELDEARGKLAEQKKAAKEMESGLRILENRKAASSRLESEIGEKSDHLKGLDTDVSEKRRELRQVERELIAKQKSLQKMEKRERGFAARLSAKTRSAGDLELANRKGISALEAERKKLEDENGKLSKLIAEKTASIQELDGELEDKQSRQDKLARNIAEKTSEIRNLDRRLQDAGVTLLNPSPENPPSPDRSTPRGARRISLDRKRPARHPEKAIPFTSASASPNRQLPPPPAPENGSGEHVPLRIISPHTREIVNYYSNGAGSFDPGHHPPIGIHALAACTRGSVHRTAESLPSGNYAVLILLSGSLEKDRELIHNVARHTGDKPVLACWREGRLDKFAAKLEGGSAFQQFTDMLGGVDGLISTDPRTSALLEELQVARRSIEIPFPCPLDAPGWNFSIPLEKRDSAIFVAADGFDPQSEEHRARIEIVNALVEEHHLKVTLYHHLPDIIEGLKVPEDLLAEPTRTLSYGEFLSMMARHRFVTGFGKNLAGGTAWGDALLTRTVSIGGKNGMESLLFPETCLDGNQPEEVRETIGKLLSDSAAYEESVEESRRRALGRVSFDAVRDQIEKFLGSISQELLTIS